MQLLCSSFLTLHFQALEFPSLFLAMQKQSANGLELG